MDVSVIMPTKDRAPLLRVALERLAAQRDADFELIVIDDRSTDETPVLLREFAERAPMPVTVLQGQPTTISVHRNRGIEIAKGSVCLFLGDDTWPPAGLVAAHAAFHAGLPAEEDALLGLIRWAPELRASPFQEWLDTNEGPHFGYGQIRDRDLVPGRYFYGSHASAKTTLLRRVGGFDPALGFGGEDIELGFRLEREGMRLHYDPSLVVDHFHPQDLDTIIPRMRVVARGGRAVTEAGWPGRGTPRRPGVRHRAGAALLMALRAAGVRHPGVRQETWRFLCHEAYRESWWEVDPPPGEVLRIGRRLLRSARQDEEQRIVVRPSDRTTLDQ